MYTHIHTYITYIHTFITHMGAPKDNGGAGPRWTEPVIRHLEAAISDNNKYYYDNDK